MLTPTLRCTPHLYKRDYTTVTLSSVPRSLERFAPYEGGVDITVGEALRDASYILYPINAMKYVNVIT
jgi:hypothetical protein